MNLKDESLKGIEVNMSDAKDVRDTKILDGGAQDSPVLNEANATKQYKTPGLPKGDYGGRNNQDG